MSDENDSLDTQEDAPEPISVGEEKKPITTEELYNSLTEEQKKKILDLWNSRKDNPPSLQEMAVAAFGPLSKKELDGKSRYCIVIRKFLVHRRRVLEQKKQIVENDNYVLTEEQKLFIAANHQNMRVSEMAKLIFELEEEPEPTEKLCSVILDFIKGEMGGRVTDVRIEKDSVYFPPKTMESAARRVNKYIYNAIDLEDIPTNPNLQTCLKQLIRFCRMFRFKMMIDNFQDKTHKELFEGSFIRYVWDKPDLSEVELDMVCNICNDIVSYTAMQKEEEKLIQMRDNCADDSEGKKISMSLVESLKDLRKVRDENHKRQSAMWKALEGTRNERLAGKIKENASILNLVKMWREQEGREKMLRIANLRQQAVAEEIKRLNELDEVKVKILGITTDELLN